MKKGSKEQAVDYFKLNQDAEMIEIEGRLP